MESRIPTGQPFYRDLPTSKFLFKKCNEAKKIIQTTLADNKISCMKLFFWIIHPDAILWEREYKIKMTFIRDAFNVTVFNRRNIKSKLQEKVPLGFV